MTGRETLRRYGPWLLLILAFAAYYPRFAKQTPPGVARVGVDLLAHGAECLLKGEVLQVCELFFTYPPSFALAMMPLVPMGPGLRVLVWYLILAGATVAAYALCEALARRLFPGEWTESERVWLRVGSILLSLKFILAVLETQAFDTVILLLVVIGLWALVSKRDLLAGGSLALAAAFKGTPLIFLPYLLFTRRFAASGVFVAVLIGVSVLPDLLFTPKGSAHGYLVTWVREIALGPMYDDPHLTRYRFWVGPNSNNHSLRAMVYQWFPNGLGDPRFRPALAAVYLAVLIAVGLVVLKSLRNGTVVAIDGAALVIAMMVLSPMSSRSHFVALMLPYTIVCAACIRDPQTRTLHQIVLGISFILATATGNDLVGGRITDWAYSHSVIAFGSLVLLISLAAIVWRPRPWLESGTAEPAARP